MTVSSSSSLNSTLVITQESIRQSQPVRNINENRRYDNCDEQEGSRRDRDIEKIAACPAKTKQEKIVLR